MSLLFSGLLLAALLAVASAARANQIYLDFGGGLSNPTGNWNVIATINTTDSNLIDFGSGSGTGASLTTSGWLNTISNTGIWGPAADKDWVQELAAEDLFVASNGSTATATLSGLTAPGYVVEVVVAWTVTNHLDVTVGGVFADDNFDGTAGVDGDDFNADADGGEPGNWLIWDNVAPASGSLTIQVAAMGQLNGDQPMLNAVRLTAIPEPSTLLLVVCGLAGLAMWRPARTRRSI